MQKKINLSAFGSNKFLDKLRQQLAIPTFQIKATQAALISL